MMCWMVLSAGPRSRSHSTRLAMGAAVVGALAVLALSVLLNWPFGDGATPEISDAQPGTCLDWSRSDASDTHQVTCDRPHLFEVTGTASVRPEFGDGAAFPNTEQWQQLKQQRCTSASRGFLHGRLDPHGRFSVGAFTPGADAWERGDRTLHCGLQEPGASGRLYQFTGAAAAIDQSNTYPTGTCLGISGTSVTDPTDCARAHSVEVTGVVNLGVPFHDRYPAEQDQDTFLASKCTALTDQYAGGPMTAKAKGLTVYWDTLVRESWDAGSRQVNCKVSAQLPDNSGLAPVTGSITGPVQIGRQPALEQPSDARPGEPAASSR